MIWNEKRDYRGWKNSYYLSNGTVELTVLADVGPRVVRFAFCGDENNFYECDEHAGLIGGKDFRLYGGHRLWVWPEVARTYYPDNQPVEVNETPRGAIFCAPVEAESPGTGLQRKFELQLAPEGPHVVVKHSVSNCGDATTRLAPWAPTILPPGGRAILPFPLRAAMDQDHFRSVAPLTLWSFTDFTDARWIVGQDFLQLVQDKKPNGRFPEQMTGLFNSFEWGAYVRGSHIFLKRAMVQLNSQYPDFGCNFEVFTNPEFLELETLGPVVELLPGESTVHTEHWWLFNAAAPISTEESIRAQILPLIEKTEGYLNA